jgi:hypothetical protein
LLILNSAFIANRGNACLRDPSAPMLAIRITKAFQKRLSLNLGFAPNRAAFFVFPASARLDNRLHSFRSDRLALRHREVQIEQDLSASTSATRVSSITRASTRSSSTPRLHSPSVMPSLSTTVDSRSHSTSVILQPTVRLRIWPAGMEEGLQGSIPAEELGVLFG